MWSAIKNYVKNRWRGILYTLAGVIALAVDEREAGLLLIGAGVRDAAPQLESVVDRITNHKPK